MAALQQFAAKVGVTSLVPWGCQHQSGCGWNGQQAPFDLATNLGGRLSPLWIGPNDSIVIP